MEGIRRYVPVSLSADSQDIVLSRPPALSRTTASTKLQQMDTIKYLLTSRCALVSFLYVYFKKTQPDIHPLH